MVTGVVVILRQNNGTLSLSLSSTNEAFKCGLTITHLPQVLLVTTLQPHVDVGSRGPRDMASQMTKEIVNSIVPE